MIDSRDSAMSLVRDGHHPGKNARPRESFPRDVCIPLRYAPTTRFPLNRVKAEKRKRKKMKLYDASNGFLLYPEFYLIKFRVRAKQDEMFSILSVASLIFNEMLGNYGNELLTLMSRSREDLLFLTSIKSPY